MSEPLPCIECGELPVAINDDVGFSCVHICRGANGLGGAWNYTTLERAVVAWNEYLGGQSGPGTNGEGQP